MSSGNIILRQYFLMTVHCNILNGCFHDNMLFSLFTYCPVSLVDKKTEWPACCVVLYFWNDGTTFRHRVVNAHFHDGKQWRQVDFKRWCCIKTVWVSLFFFFRSKCLLNICLHVGRKNELTRQRRGERETEGGEGRREESFDESLQWRGGGCWGAETTSTTLIWLVL